MIRLMPYTKEERLTIAIYGMTHNVCDCIEHGVYYVSKGAKKMYCPKCNMINKPIDRLYDLGLAIRRESNMDKG